MQAIKDFITFLDGKKVFIGGTAVLIYAIAIKDLELIMYSLTALGFRDAIRKLK